MLQQLEAESDFSQSPIRRVAADKAAEHELDASAAGPPITVAIKRKFV